MAKLFGVDIAGILHQSLSKGLVPGTLLVDAPGVRDPDNPTVLPIGVTASHNFRGILQNYADKEIDGNLVLKEDKQLLVIANSIQPRVVPEPGMSFRITDTPGLWRIERVKRDPASATYLCQARK